ncbi:nickel pincer cofactor biosynthesis protein LarB [Desulfovibrio mangrovi]|uniref:nickel pincer cofactor biosynthesis protein LarB n=1 Tax=Desulfovibrio mangrovi TaxID=2976983 RepID=UPI00224871C4|nr:nickel pincer cofactor biosynthesis protein LarB [Desulfovibrio mangrovi]UZP68878.1 nickel pincer cofactor biosynthesis protein LarB [Desulfovibrio mangrovi]
MHDHDMAALLRATLNAVAEGTLPPGEAALRLKTAPCEATLNGVHVDHHRAMRTGLGEAVLALGKSDDRLVTAVERLSEQGTPVLATRVSAAQGALLQEHFPQGTHHPDAGLFCLGRDLGLMPPFAATGEVLVVTAGAADMHVALEALGTARFYGLDAGLVPDVGVAGLHRIGPHLAALHEAKLLIVVAGMEGALPSVVAGLCSCPVIGVPTSVGYGAGAGGITPLFAMLNSCAAGISVVNIDNGYGAAVFATKILNTFRHE